MCACIYSCSNMTFMIMHNCFTCHHSGPQLSLYMIILLYDVREFVQISIYESNCSYIACIKPLEQNCMAPCRAPISPFVSLYLCVSTSTEWGRVPVASVAPWTSALISSSNGASGVRGGGGGNSLRDNASACSATWHLSEVGHDTSPRGVMTLPNGEHDSSLKWVITPARGGT